MLLSALRWLYRRLGPHYPRLMVALQLVTAHTVYAGGIALFSVYQAMSHDELVTLICAGQLLMLAEDVVMWRAESQVIRGADPWLRGARGPTETVAAWRALARVPIAWMRVWKWPVFADLVPFCVIGVVVLDLAWWAGLLIFLGGLVVLLYGATLRFFLLELTMRPVLEKIGRDLPAEHSIIGTGIPLRWRLLAGIPALNIITGVIVAGLSTNETQTLSDLGLDVLVAVLVAFTVSLELTLLLGKSILVPIDDLRRATQRVKEGELDVQVPVYSTDETGALAQSFNQMTRGLAERERLREAFGAFVDPGLAERVLAEGTLLEGEDVEVTVLFVDIRGFTALAERSSAAEVVERLNDFYELIVPAIAGCGGHANKFVGDGLLAVFGAPDRLPDHADRAVDCALTIARVVRRRYNGGLRIGIGVNSGPVVAGTIGGGGRVEFTVIGDAVNTAARVEEATRTTGDVILLTGATRALLTRPIELQERPALPLKGKRERVRLFAPADQPDAGAAVEAYTDESLQVRR